MPSSREISLRDWLDLETKLSTRSPLPAERGVELRFLRSSDGGHFRLAQALLREDPSIPWIERIRIDLARGDFESAKRRLEAYADRIDPGTEESCEAELSRAKLSYHSADWTSALEVLRSVLESPHLRGVSRIAALQIRAACWFEVGDLERALRDLDLVRSLVKLYPQSVSAFYADALHAKILARQSPVSAATALDHLTVAWTDPVAAPDLDVVLTLLRLRLDINRQWGGPISAVALACYRIADAMGDDLYAALACIDLAHGDHPSIAREAERWLARHGRGFDKVVKTIDAIAGRVARWESLRYIGMPARERELRNFDERDTHELDPTTGSILILGARDMSVDLRASRLEFPVLQPRYRDLIAHLASGPIARVELFERVWKIKYRGQAHDAILRTALSRSRKQSGIDIECIDGRVQTRALIVIG